MKTNGHTRPRNVEIDKIKNGIATILVCWDIVEKSRTFDDIEETYWEYDECRMKWTLPTSYTSISDIQQYFDGIYDELVNWAKGCNINFIRGR